ncbi:MAG: META domain-containing protein, partial [Frankiaceae bacterium]|nr:META domain-containing protein [Frankiaceae bacterium]
MNAQRLLAGIGIFAVFVGTSLGIAAAVQSPVGAAAAAPGADAPAAASPGADGLVGVTWRVSAVGTEGESANPVTDAAVVTLTLNPDGTYRGNDGTNSLTGGTYRVDGTQLTLDRNGISTLMDKLVLTSQDWAGRSLFGTNGGQSTGAMTFALTQDPQPTLTVDTGAWVLVFHADPAGTTTPAPVDTTAAPPLNVSIASSGTPAASVSASTAPAASTTTTSAASTSTAPATTTTTAP